MPVGKAEQGGFAHWLRDALGDRKNVWLVKQSPMKDNGRPVIDDSRVSKWLAGGQRPSMENAILVARLLDRPPSEALVAAGYSYGRSLETFERIEREQGGVTSSEPNPGKSTPALADVSNEELAEEVRRRLIAGEEEGAAQVLHLAPAARKTPTGKPTRGQTRNRRVHDDPAE